MKIAFFFSSESQSRLTAEATKWLGTPFHRYANLRGAGVDCVHLVAEIYAEMGLLRRPLGLPVYQMDSGHHLNASLLLAYLDCSGRFDAIPFDRLARNWGCVGCGEGKTNPGIPNLMVGDLLGFKVGKVIHHCGLFLGGPQDEFIHSIAKYGTVLNTLQDFTWLSRLEAIRRPLL